MKSDPGGTRRFEEGSNRPSSIHVVVADMDVDWILGRYAQILHKWLGWTVGTVHQPQATLNYYMPYLLLKGRKPSTKVGAWFTHLEENKQRSKVQRWHWAARNVDIRLCQASKYHQILAQHGPTVQIPTPVDTVKFRPRKLRVGVAGRVYVGGRKGEHLVAKLLEIEGFEVVGAGRGWPCPTTFYSWEMMQEFYRSLDVFLITSLVEGGPDTALEALACGIPVVGPRDVGMLDELPILRYERDNFDQMVARLRTLLQGRIERWRVVADRTEERFAQAYKEALESVL